MGNKILFQKYSFQPKPQLLLQIVKPKTELDINVNCQIAKRMRNKYSLQNMASNSSRNAFYKLSSRKTCLQ
jgi:hypothetical protein